jgi:two-component system, chemotaxis family, protein-glutamate methylesterase/glutaminase
VVKVLIVDDSRVVQQFMIHIFSYDQEIEVVGVAGSGEEAISIALDKKPDVITMDVYMPGMDGYEATRKIMEIVPTPIVIVSGILQADDVTNSFRLFESGALAIVPRPPWMEDPEFVPARKTLIQTVKLMAEVKVVRRFPKQSKDRVKHIHPIHKLSSETKDVKLIAIGASTGGPAVLKTILTGFPKDLSVPVVIVQHIAKEFVKGLVDWLAVFSELPLHIPEDGEYLLPGHVYIAPDDFQMGLLPGLRIRLTMSPSENGLSPSVDYLFRSVAEHYGSNALGILLTGMGKDGATELKTMKDKGSITIVQDEESCVVFGMPGEAVKIGAAGHILSPEKIAAFITEFFQK